MLRKSVFRIAVASSFVALMSGSALSQSAPKLVPVAEKATPPLQSATTVSRHAKSAKANTAAPSNAQLFEMIKAMQAQQAALVQQTKQAQAEAEKAKRELAATKQRLEDAQAKIAANTEQVKETAETVETIEVATVGITQTPAPGGQTVMGSQLSTTAVTVETTPGVFMEAGASAAFVGDAGHEFAAFDPDGDVTATGLNGGYDTFTEDETSAEIIGAIGWRDQTGKEVRASFAYLDFNSDESCRVADANAVCLLSNAFHGLTSGGGVNGVGSDELDDPGDLAEGSLDIERGLVDLEAGKTLALGQNLGLTVSGGPRIAWIDHSIEFSATQTDGAGTVQDSTDIKRSNDIFGAGGKLGAALTWKHRGLTLSSGASASLLVANREFELDQINGVREPGVTASRTNLANFTRDETVLLPVLDLQTALTWNFMMGSNAGYISGGYKYQSWIDAIRNDVQTAAGEILSRTHDLAIHGPFLKAGITWGGHRYDDPIK